MVAKKSTGIRKLDVTYRMLTLDFQVLCYIDIVF